MASFEVSVFYPDLRRLQHPLSLFVYAALNQTLFAWQSYLSRFSITLPKQPFYATLKSLALTEANNRTPLCQTEENK